MQPTDGKIILGGYFDNINGTARRGIGRLNADGTLDPSFNVTQTEGGFLTVALQPDGKIVVAGTFGHVNGAVRNNMARLNADGTLDTSFNAGVNGALTTAVAVQSDRKILVLHSSGGFILPVNNIGRILGFSYPPFFSGEVSLSNDVYYLQVPNGTPFGYYSYLTDPRYIYHFDLGYEYLFDANDGKNGVYLYDFASKSFFYTSPSYPFPYLYDFSLNTVLYYYPDKNNPGRYTTNPRYFFNFNTGQIITK